MNVGIQLQMSSAAIPLQAYITQLAAALKQRQNARPSLKKKEEAYDKYYSPSYKISNLYFNNEILKI